jgi:hypothetical protein
LILQAAWTGILSILLILLILSKSLRFELTFVSQSQQQGEVIRDNPCHPW